MSDLHYLFFPTIDFLNFLSYNNAHNGLNAYNAHLKGANLKTLKTVTEFAFLFTIFFALMRIEEFVRKITQYTK